MTTSAEVGQDSETVIKQINRRLKCMDLEIRGYYVGEEKVFGLINLVNDDVAKNDGGSLDDAQLEVFKHILKQLAENAEHKAATSDLEDHRGRLTVTKFNDLIDTLCDNQWLARDGDELLTYGARSYLELTENLRAAGAEVPQIIHL